MKPCLGRSAVLPCLLLVTLWIAPSRFPARTASAADTGAKTIRALGGTPPAGTTKIGFGSAFFINARGDLVTAEHVVASCRVIRVAGPDLAAMDAEVKVIDHPHDLALLHVDGVRSDSLTIERLPPFKAAVVNEGVLLFSDPGSFSKLGAISSLNEELVDVGFPGLASASPVTLPMKPLGIAVASDHDWRIFLQGGAMPGQSGSPVLDQQGKVIGMFSQAVLRPGHAAVVVPNLGEAWDSALVVPATMISEFLARRAVHDAQTPSSSSSLPSQDRATVKVFCFI